MSEPLVFNGLPLAGTTAQRPTNASTGQPYYDKTIRQWLVWDADQGAWLTAQGDTPPQPGAGTPGAGVTALELGNGVVRQTVLTLTDVPVTVGNTTGVSFGGSSIYEFPEGRIALIGATMANITFDLTDDGNVTPIDDADGGDVSIGTTAPSDGTLTGTDVDIIPSTSIDPISDGIAGAALSASTQFDGTTTPVEANLNVLIDDADVGNGASDVILVSGTVTMTWINLGDF